MSQSLRGEEPIPGDAQLARQDQSAYSVVPPSEFCSVPVAVDPLNRMGSSRRRRWLRVELKF